MSWNMLLDVAADALIDSVKMLPFLFAAYLLLEYIEHRASARFQQALAGLGRFGAVGGALLGCVPQCGFSVTAANLYAGRVITLGTLVAVFLSTSDEAIPVLLGSPEHLGEVLPLLGIKLVIAVASGLLIDLFVSRRKRAVPPQEQIHELCAHCDCEHGIFRSALHHTLQIFLFILLFSLLLGGAIALVGEETLARLLMSDSLWQPLVAGLIGFIPNCAASVLLTQLYLAGSLSLGAVVSGLCTAAGVGLAVLFRVNRDWKENARITALLYLVAVCSGVAIDLMRGIVA